MAHGLEARVPFLDRDVLDAVMETNPDFKLYRKVAPPHRTLPFLDLTLPDLACNPTRPDLTPPYLTWPGLS